MNSGQALLIRIRGVVQGVGFRPFVFRLAHSHGIRGWILNDGDGVRIHAEGDAASLEHFTSSLVTAAPPAAQIVRVETEDAEVRGHDDFRIAGSERSASPTAPISPDLPVCADCLGEMCDSADRRAGYAYINCTNCGPRYSIVLSLPYDRAATTMATWKMCSECSEEYADPANRRFHAQPNACPRCGPSYSLRRDLASAAQGSAAIKTAAAMLCEGKIVAIKGIGGYHLACDAANRDAVLALRERKFRKERPFAVMARDVSVAREAAELSAEAELLLVSTARPIVVAARRVELEAVAPDTNELGVMLPYTPIHHLLFAHGAPDLLVMTSANRSSEPIAYKDDEALEQLAGIADAFLIGDRAIARRVDDSVVRAGSAGTVMLRRSRGYSPGIVARIPSQIPILALGGDLKNSVTLVRNGDAVMSQHIGDLSHLSAMEAFRETIADLTSMYAVDMSDTCVVHDMHPQYASTVHALAVDCGSRRAVQHHRAHIASVLAEYGAFDERVVGVAFDGTGYGDDGTIWGGEFFVGSVRAGLERVGHLRSVRMPGGDAAARYPVQAAAGFLAEVELEGIADMTAGPFRFPEKFLHARELINKNVRCFPTTSAGRLFDTVAALLGFTREVTYEGQAAIWLEQLAMQSPRADALSMPFVAAELDFRPALIAIVEARCNGRGISEIARSFHSGLARGVTAAIGDLAEEHGVRTAVLSGGVFQNDLLLSEVLENLRASRIAVWTNRLVPANDGGLSLGQAALSAYHSTTTND